MKKLFFVAVAAIADLGVSCEETIFPNKIEDKPFVEFFEESMTDRWRNALASSSEIVSTPPSFENDTDSG